MDTKTATATREELFHALVDLFPWALTYIEAQRTPLHGVGDFDRIARARALIVRELGEAEAVRQIGEPRHERARFKQGGTVGTLAQFIASAGDDFELAGWLKCANVGQRYRGITRIR